MITKARLERLKMGLTMREFARQVGIHEDQLGRVERGQAYIPPAWRNKLAKALDVSEDALCSADGWPKKVS